MRRISSALFVGVLALSGVTFAAGDAAKKPAAPAKAPAKKPPPPKKVAPKKLTPVSAEHKKALASLFGQFKFGMSKDDVLKAISKQLDEQYDEKLKATTDIPTQDRLRKEKKAELARVEFVAFEGKRTGWDVSIVEDEFAHNTGESMLERWENQGGKNQRRFFFFFEGKLWKMFISLDVSILPEDKLNFETFRSTMERMYGPGDVEGGRITWRTDSFDARAVDKLKSYGALAQVVEDPRVRAQLEAVREAKAPPRNQGNPMIQSVIDKGNKDHPSVKADSTTVDTVIRAQGGSPPPNQ